MELLIEPLSLVLALLGALVVWAGCRAWYGRKMRKLGARIQKLQTERETLQEQVKQARQQIVQIQQDLTARVKADTAAARARASANPGAAAAALQAQAAARAKLEAQLAIPSGMVSEAPQQAAHGFDDTMPFEEEN